MNVSETQRAAASAVWGMVNPQNQKQNDAEVAKAKKVDGETTGVVAVNFETPKANSTTSVNAIKESYKDTLRNDGALFNNNFSSRNGHLDMAA